MTLMIELTPEEERRVQGAQQQGIDVTTLLRNLIAGLPALARPVDMSPQERAAAFRAWAAQHEPTPLLSEEAISRESIYGDHG